ncbi:MAG: hypothetical protein E7Z84_05830 [Methanosphaera stadtmanae]|nr:hypothetical protein [Methanosphaera stadtmanae]
MKNYNNNLSNYLDLLKQIIKYSVGVIILIKLILFVYFLSTGNSVDPFILTNSTGYISFLFTAFLIVFTLSQFILTQVTNNFSSYALNEFKKDPRLIKFILFGFTSMILCFIWYSTKNSIMIHFTIPTSLITIYFIIDLIELQFEYSNPLSYIKMIENKLEESYDFETIKMVSDISTKYMLKKEYSITKKALNLLFKLIEKLNEDNDENSVDYINSIINQIYYVYDISLNEPSEEISSYIGEKLYEIFLKDYHMLNSDKTNESPFLQAFILSDGKMDPNNPNKKFSSFYERTLSEKHDSFIYLKEIFLYILNYIYLESDFMKLKPEYLWDFFKQLIDYDNYEKFKHIINEIPSLETRTLLPKRNGDAYTKNTKLDDESLNMLYYSIGGYLLYKYVDSNINLKNYINVLRNHNIDNSSIYFIDQRVNLFYHEQMDIISLYNLYKNKYKMSYFVGSLFNLEDYIQNFIMINLMDSEDIDKLENDEEYRIVKTFLVYKEQLIMSFNLQTYELINNTSISNEDVLEKFRKIEFLTEEYLINKTFTNEFLEQVNKFLRNKIKENIKKSDNINLEETNDNLKNKIRIPIKISKDFLIDFDINENKNNLFIREDEFLTYIIKDYIYKSDLVNFYKIHYNELKEKHFSVKFNKKHLIINNLIMDCDIKVKTIVEYKYAVFQVTIYYYIKEITINELDAKKF